MTVRVDLGEGFFENLFLVESKIGTEVADVLFKKFCILPSHLPYLHLFAEPPRIYFSSQEHRSPVHPGPDKVTSNLIPFHLLIIMGVPMGANNL